MEKRSFVARVGPDERPAMPPVNGFAKRFAPEGMRALGREGLMQKAEPKTPRGYNVELGGMAPPSNY